MILGSPASAAAVPRLSGLVYLWWTCVQEIRKLGPQKRAAEGRDSCLDTAYQFVRGSQMFRLQTKVLVGKGVSSCVGEAAPSGLS